MDVRLESLKKNYKDERIKLETEFKEFLDWEIRLTEKNIKKKMIKLYSEKINDILKKDENPAIYDYMQKPISVDDIKDSLEQNLSEFSKVDSQIISSKISSEGKGIEYYKYVVQFIKVKLLEHLLKSEYKIFPEKSEKDEIVFRHFNDSCG